MSATNSSRRRSATTLPPTADSLLGRRVSVAAWRGIPPSMVRWLAGNCGPFEGGCTACAFRGDEVQRVPRQRVENVPPPRRRRDAAAGGGAVTGRFDSLAVDRPGVRAPKDHARRGVGPDHFLRFNGRNTQTCGLPGLRPVAPSLRSGYGRPPYGGRWCAARTVTRATPGTCSVLDRRPRSAPSKAQAGPRRRPLYARRACAGGTRRCALTGTSSRRRNADGVPSVRRHSRQGSSGRLHGRDHP